MGNNQQINAYQKIQKSVLKPREAEAMAFTKAAVLLEEAIAKPEDKGVFRQAVRFNHLLWTIIQADIAEESNTLPDELKANIMSLSIFIDGQTEDALRSLDVSKLPVMVSINQNIAAGLHGMLADVPPQDDDESSDDE